MGATPNIRLKGMSQMRYNFLWDPEIRHFAYEPKNQKEVDDIFRTQGKIYRTMYFSVYMDEPDHHFVKEEPAHIPTSAGAKDRPTVKGKKQSKKQPVAEAVTSE